MQSTTDLTGLFDGAFRWIFAGVVLIVLDGTLQKFIIGIDGDFSPWRLVLDVPILLVVVAYWSRYLLLTPWALVISEKRNSKYAFISLCLLALESSIAYAMGASVRNWEDVFFFLIFLPVVDYLFLLLMAIMMWSDSTLRKGLEYFPQNLLDCAFPVGVWVVVLLPCGLKEVSWRNMLSASMFLRTLETMDEIREVNQFAIYLAIVLGGGFAAWRNWTIDVLRNHIDMCYTRFFRTVINTKSSTSSG